jgi:hypothetical protein
LRPAHDAGDHIATGCEVSGRIAEALNLLRLSEQVGDGVVDEIDERVLVSPPVPSMERSR